jgi:hypothetical protein
LLISWLHDLNAVQWCRKVLTRAPSIDTDEIGLLLPRNCVPVSTPKVSTLLDTISSGANISKSNAGLLLFALIHYFLCCKQVIKLLTYCSPPASFDRCFRA